MHVLDQSCLFLFPGPSKVYGSDTSLKVTGEGHYLIFSRRQLLRWRDLLRLLLYIYITRIECGINFISFLTDKVAKTHKILGSSTKNLEIVKAVINSTNCRENIYINRELWLRKFYVSYYTRSELIRRDGTGRK